MQKINFIPPIVFEILKFKNTAIWLAEGIFAFYLKTRFFQTCCFQNHKVHYGAWFKFRKFTHQWTIFLKYPKTPIFRVFWGIVPKIRFFSQKFGSVSFSTLRHPNFMRSFRKALWAVLEKTRLPTDILTYWLLTYWNHSGGEIIGPLYT